jgi:hypothetical protein
MAWHNRPRRTSRRWRWLVVWAVLVGLASCAVELVAKVA